MLSFPKPCGMRSEVRRRRHHRPAAAAALGTPVGVWRRLGVFEHALKAGRFFIPALTGTGSFLLSA